MSRNNSTDFSSWNIKDPAQRDPRNWDPDSAQTIQDHFQEYQILHSLEQLAQDAPEALRDGLSGSPNNPAAALKALAELNQRKHEQLLVKAGRKKPAAKQRKGWDNLEISRSVRKILDQK